VKEFIKKYSSLLAALALVVTSLTVNSTCIFTMHQDEVPEVAKKLRKF
jgi:cyclic lactone autoinducer peptide